MSLAPRYVQAAARRAAQVSAARVPQARPERAHPRPVPAADDRRAGAGLAAARPEARAPAPGAGAQSSERGVPEAPGDPCAPRRGRPALPCAPRGRPRWQTRGIHRQTASSAPRRQARQGPSWRPSPVRPRRKVLQSQPSHLPERQHDSVPPARSDEDGPPARPVAAGQNFTSSREIRMRAGSRAEIPAAGCSNAGQGPRPHAPGPATMDRRPGRGAR